MDKSWMLKNKFSDEYKTGVDSFIKFATQNLSEDDLISCPCKECGSVKHKRQMS